MVSKDRRYIVTVLYGAVRMHLLPRVVAVGRAGACNLEDGQVFVKAVVILALDHAASSARLPSLQGIEGKVPRLQSRRDLQEM